ncbi:hypothetical protein ACGFMK_26770 [Amycolatopsis sp. NPDC049252]|uniref:hypothetical protein n=1 Tax=Amycolatopsis sp. NPDC049252 TaxID=3363933 RepID=UPI003721FB0D
MTACYPVEFTFQGLDDLPHRVDCPPDATPITPPPAPPPATVPGTSDAPLKAVLTALPATTTEADVLAALARPCPDRCRTPKRTSPHRRRRSGAPSAVATSAWPTARPTRSTASTACSAHEPAANVLVWRPSWLEVQPGELTCVPEGALARQAVTPPH